MKKRYEKANSISPACINFIADALVRNLFGDEGKSKTDGTVRSISK